MTWSGGFCVAAVALCKPVALWNLGAIEEQLFSPLCSLPPAPRTLPVQTLAKGTQEAEDAPGMESCGGLVIKGSVRYKSICFATSFCDSSYSSIYMEEYSEASRGRVTSCYQERQM